PDDDHPLDDREQHHEGLNEYGESSHLASRTENRAPDAHHRRSLLDRDLEIFTHSHRQLREPDLIAQSAEPPEVGAGIANRRNGHQADEIHSADSANLPGH